MQEINFYDLIKYYANKWMLIVVFTIAGLMLGLVFNIYIQKPSYTSDATLIPVNSNQTVTTDPTVINNYIDLFKARSVLDPVIKSLHLSLNYDQLSNDVTASNDKNTEVLKLSITTSNPTISRLAANATVNSFLSEVKQIYGANSIQIIDNANTPLKPSNVHKSFQLIIFTTAGFLISVITIFFIYDLGLQKTKSSLKNKKIATLRINKSKGTRIKFPVKVSKSKKSNKITKKIK